MGGDLDLVRRCQQGDTRAFRELVERYEARIYALSCSIVGDRELARDAVQEAFVRAYRALPRFRAKSSFYTWLYRIATNTSLNIARKEGRRLDDISIDALQETREISADRFFGTDQPENDIERADLRRNIQTVLNALSPDHRAVVILKDLEDMSQEEIAETLNCSVGTVKSRLSRARAQLRDLLRPLYNEWREKES